MKRCSHHISWEKSKWKQWASTTHLLEWPESGTLITPNAGEDLEQLEPLLIAGGHAKPLWKPVLWFLTKLSKLLASVQFSRSVVSDSLRPHESQHHTATAAAKSLQSCPTLCDPIDGSPTGSPIPGILHARTLEWVAISFSNAWKWKVKMKSLSRVWLPATPWTAAQQAPPSIGFSRQEYWSGVPLPSPKLAPQALNKYL